MAPILASADHNQQLSLKRAQTVANFLISQGVNPNLVQTRGLSMPTRSRRMIRRRGGRRTAASSSPFPVPAHGVGTRAGCRANGAPTIPFVLD
jgi:hypothetical protein